MHLLSNASGQALALKHMCELNSCKQMHATVHQVRKKLVAENAT